MYKRKCEFNNSGGQNLRVGYGNEVKVICEDGLGERNIRGDRLKELFTKHRLVVDNAIFQNRI